MGKPNFQNRTLFHGDNLKFLQAMNSESVDLVATDPPFKKGRDFHATPDSLAKGASFQDRWSWEKDVHQEWVDQITDDDPKVMNVIQGSRSSYGDDMGAFLCFMAVRLLAMRRVLKSSGSIYLHCDPTASHYLKELMDAVFGRRNFVNEIVWCYKTGGASSRSYAKKHDIILFYTKGKSCTFHAAKEKSYQGVGYSTGNKNVSLFYDNKAGRMGPHTLVNAKDWWEIPMVATSNKTERVGFPTQKPLALYERIIAASSDEGDMVLDPFCGCATTAVVCERLGREWVGIDIWDSAHKIVVDRLKRQPDLDLFADVHYSTELPIRTDDGDTSAPFLRVKQSVREPDGPRMSRAQMYEVLLSRQGVKCRGCDRKFDDPRYLELDHNTPRADGGINHISNRILLCSPCNRAKSNTYTLSGLRKLNKKNEWMSK